jgi:hypothetical protein
LRDWDVIAYNLGNLLRRLVLPRRIANWSLTGLQQRLVKTGGRLVKHAVLLASAGREPPDAATVCSHVGQDHVATATDGIATRRPSQSGGICLQRFGIRRSVAKVGCKWRNFGCAGSESRTVGGDPDKDCFGNYIVDYLPAPLQEESGIIPENAKRLSGNHFAFHRREGLDPRFRGDDKQRLGLHRAAGMIWCHPGKRKAFIREPLCNLSRKR